MARKKVKKRFSAGGEAGRLAREKGGSPAAGGNIAGKRREPPKHQKRIIQAEVLFAALRFRRNLVFGASTGFVVGHGFVRQENSSRRTALPRCKFGSNLLDFGLAEAHAAHLDGAVCVNQEECRNVGEAVLVGDRIALFIEEGGKSNAVFGAEFLGVARVILGNAPKGSALAAVGLEKALEKREGELADRAGDLEERGDDGPFLQRVLQ